MDRILNTWFFLLDHVPCIRYLWRSGRKDTIYVEFSVRVNISNVLHIQTPIIKHHVRIHLRAFDCIILLPSFSCHITKSFRVVVLIVYIVYTNINKVFHEDVSSWKPWTIQKNHLAINNCAPFRRCLTRKPVSSMSIQGFRHHKSSWKPLNILHSFVLIL